LNTQEFEGQPTPDFKEIYISNRKEEKQNRSAKKNKPNPMNTEFTEEYLSPRIGKENKKNEIYKCYS
jgi:hypothetical protein